MVCWLVGNLYLWFCKRNKSVVHTYFTVSSNISLSNSEHCNQSIVIRTWRYHTSNKIYALFSSLYWDHCISKIVSKQRNPVSTLFRYVKSPFISSMHLTKSVLLNSISSISCKLELLIVFALPALVCLIMCFSESFSLLFIARNIFCAKLPIDLSVMVSERFFRCDCFRTSTLCDRTVVFSPFVTRRDVLPDVLWPLVVKCKEICVVASEADKWRVFKDGWARESIEYMVDLFWAVLMFLLKSCFRVFWNRKKHFHYYKNGNP